MSGDAPSGTRTPLGAALSAQVRADGALVLPVCGDCGTVQYPARAVCGSCLSDRLYWQPVDRAARVLSWSVGHASVSPYFNQRLPWIIGRVRLAAGPAAIVHLHGRLQRMDAPTRVYLVRDAAGQGVLCAMPPDGSPPADARAADALVLLLGQP